MKKGYLLILIFPPFLWGCYPEVNETPLAPPPSIDLISGVTDTSVAPGTQLQFIFEANRNLEGKPLQTINTYLNGLLISIDDSSGLDYPYPVPANNDVFIRDTIVYNVPNDGGFYTFRIEVEAFDGLLDSIIINFAVRNLAIHDSVILGSPINGSNGNPGYYALGDSARTFPLNQVENNTDSLSMIFFVDSLNGFALSSPSDTVNFSQFPVLNVGLWAFYNNTELKKISSIGVFDFDTLSDPLLIPNIYFEDSVSSSTVSRIREGDIIGFRTEVPEKYGLIKITGTLPSLATINAQSKLTFTAKVNR